LSVAKNNFLEHFGQNVLSTIRKESGINNASIAGGKLQLSGTNAAVTKIEYYLEQTLHEKNVSITCSMKQHLELTCHGRMLKEFSKKHRVGTSLQELFLHGKKKGNNTPNKDLRRGRRGHHTNRGRGGSRPNSASRDVKADHRGNHQRGQRGRGRSPAHHLMPTHIPDLTNLNLNVSDTYTSEKNRDDSEEGKRREQYNAQNDGYEDETKEDNDDDNNSETSDSDASILPNFATNTSNMKNFDKCTDISLCSDSEASLSKAIIELQSYSLYTDSWAITADQFTFISQQQQQGKPLKNNTSTKERCLQIKTYLHQAVENYFVHIYVTYTRGMWSVKVRGLKSDVNSAVFKIKGYLNDVVGTEVQIPISKAMGFYLRTKGSSDIKRLGDTHNIKIITFSLPRRATNNDEHDNDNDCLKLVGSISRINLAQVEVRNFLENLSEQEENFPCDSWDLSKNISKSIITRLKKIQDSDDYEAIGLVKFYESAIERRQTTPKITFTVIGLNEETTDDVIQQCKDIIEGYVVWKPSLDEYRALSNTLLVQKRPNIDRFRQEWDTYVQLESPTNTVIIPARSKIIADEIKEALQNLAAGKANRMDRISVNIPIQINIRRFVSKAIQPLLDEARTQKVFVDSKDRNGLTLHGRSEVVTSIQDKINTTINDIKRSIVTNHLKLLFIESELIRADSYQVVKRVERETNTIIRDVRIDATSSTLNANDDNDDTSVTITCVTNSRGQMILVKKGDITKVKDVDAIINAANGPLYHAGGVDKVISDAAGPALDRECKELIAKNGGVAISTGQAVKTTAGCLPYKSVIHVIGPQYSGGNHQERPLLFSCILSSLRIAEQEGYKSVALPAVSAATYGFPLQDCTNIVIRAVKQFFADFQESCLRKVILLDIDDAACNSFAREVVNDHTNAAADNNDDIMNYHLPPLTAKWCWQDNDGEKINNDSQTRQIEAAFQQYLQTFIPSTLKINPDNLKSGTIVCYSIHFLPNLKQKLAINPNALNSRLVCGYQMRDNTGFKRDIIRYPLALQTHTTSARYHPKPLDIYHLKMQFKEDDWDIIGINSVSIKQAEMAIRKSIASATISEPFTVNLNEDLDAHKKAITNIVTQQSIHVDFQQDSTGNLLLILKGFQQNVLQAKLQIALYVQDILKIEADKDDDLNIPKEWGEQEEQCKLIELPKNHPDSVRIEKRMKETISSVKIDKIERVQNLRLWNHYAFRRRTLQQELSNKPDLQIEMELFHGTRAALPSEIYNGEYGFDMTYCTSGLWGIGTYFAVNAAYSCQNYSYQLPNGKRQVFFAQVLTGDVSDYQNKNDQTLRRPPKKNESTSGARYNSVSGETGGSRVYIIYENRVAYPTFLITFSQ
jgi:O-acetyl-ADP-ribose deacetylase (regulator of RNase III)